MRHSAGIVSAADPRAHAFPFGTVSGKVLFSVYSERRCSQRYSQTNFNEVKCDLDPYI
jgi:hypothetical protein